ncbi:putative MFS transporter [Rhodotorula toruloides ATCC 204091]|nr:putative MFS transporter [Rhodotorula toruloides ATCC 204091]PRQ77589.1 putative MFS transporter [Rhodotorula toruloides]
MTRSNSSNTASPGVLLRPVLPIHLLLCPAALMIPPERLRLPHVPWTDEESRFEKARRRRRASVAAVAQADSQNSSKQSKQRKAGQRRRVRSERANLVDTMGWLHTIGEELGFGHIARSHSRRDVSLLFFSRFIRMAGFGSFAPVLIIFLREIGFSDRSVGLFLSATLLGDVLLSLFVTWTADAFGRRRMLALGSLLMCASGVAFALSRNYIVLLVSAIVGIVSPSGNETGPFSALEQAMLSGLTEPEGRVSLLMWYQVLGFLGISVGNNLTGVIVGGMERYGKTTEQAYRAVFTAYAAIAAIKVLISFLMTRHAEVDRPRAPAPAAPAPSAQQNGDSERQPLLQGQRCEANPILDPPAVNPSPPGLPIGRLVTLCLIFALDSFASGLAPLSFISYYLRTVHAAPVNLIAHFFSITAIIACFSQLAAASISKRLGIIGTMVGTHTPAQLLTIALGLAPTLPIALTVFTARAFLATMDGSVRGAFLAAVIPNEQRTRFLGIINVVRTLATTPGPTFSLTLVSMGHIRWSFVLMGSIKILYDICLFIGFKTARLEH